MAKLKTYSFIALIISAFLLAAACVAFAVGISTYLDDQGKTMKMVSPYLCTVSNTTLDCYKCDDATCCKATWYLECINPLLNDTSSRNATIHTHNSQSRLQSMLNMYKQYTSFIAFLYSDRDEALWSPVDAAYGTALLSTSIACVIFLTLIMSISAAMVAHSTKNGCGGTNGSSDHMHNGLPFPMMMATMM